MQISVLQFCNKIRCRNQVENTKRGSRVQKSKSTSAYKLKGNVHYDGMWKKKKLNIWFMNNSLFARSSSNKCKHMEKIVRNNSPATAIWTHSLMAHPEQSGRTFWFLDQIHQPNKTKFLHTSTVQIYKLWLSALQKCYQQRLGANQANETFTGNIMSAQRSHHDWCRRGQRY